MRIKMNYQKQENKMEMVQYIRDFINENEEVIIVNIGTDRCIGDLISPLIGTILHENNCPLIVYGTLDLPIHALNIDKRIAEIYKKHPHAKIIALDACLGDLNSIGEIQIRNVPIQAGKGVGKSLPSVGDISIIGIVDDADGSELFTNRNIRLSLIYNMAKVISDIILMASESKNIRIYNRDKNTYATINEIPIKEIAIN